MTIFKTYFPLSEIQKHHVGCEQRNDRISAMTRKITVVSVLIIRNRSGTKKNQEVKRSLWHFRKDAMEAHPMVSSVLR